MVRIVMSEELGKVLEEVLKRLERLERMLEGIEGREESHTDKSRHGLTPALVRTLAVVKELGAHGTPEDVASRLELPRNIASLYLNRLSKMGYLGKSINPDPRIRARYVYRLNEESIDPELERLISQIRNLYPEKVSHDRQTRRKGDDT
jgi:DNA-binding MarR family transcriptional regulator